MNRKRDNSNDSTVESGRHNENRAVRFLEQHGYAIVERNFRVRQGEIDVVARDGEHLVFVEVRSRASRDRGDPLDTVGHRKRAKLIKVAEIYLARHPTVAPVRFDVVGIVGTEIRLIKDAFRVGMP